MIVRDLFFNTPARLKFMKRDAAEGAAAYAAVQHVALSHPEISFRFLREPGGDDDPRRRQTPLRPVRSAGPGGGSEPAPCKGSGEELSVEGYISRPSCCRGNRSSQHFFVNGTLREVENHGGGPGGGLSEPENGGEIPRLCPAGSPQSSTPWT